MVALRASSALIDVRQTPRVRRAMRETCFHHSLYELVAEHRIGAIRAEKNDNHAAGNMDAPRQNLRIPMHQRNARAAARAQSQEPKVPTSTAATMPPVNMPASLNREWWARLSKR